MKIYWDILRRALAPAIIAAMCSAVIGSGATADTSKDTKETLARMKMILKEQETALEGLYKIEARLDMCLDKNGPADRE